MTKTFEDFKKRLDELNHYRRVMTLLDWDMYTATPERGYEEMAETLTWAASREFSLSTDPALLSLLQELNKSEEYEQLDEGMQYTVRVMLRDLTKESRIPKDFITEYVDAVNASRKAWEKAKQTSDYSLYAPHLEKVIELTKKRCGYTDPGKDTYDVLLDRYEEGMDNASVGKVFSELKEGLIPMLKAILAKEHRESTICQGTYDPDAQKKVQRLLLEYIGFDHQAGCTAESEHPFTLGFSRNDVRITNHFHEDNPIFAMFSGIHEGGHAIFEQNVDPALKGTAADDCTYMGVHESQSRFFENILGRRRSFWVPVYPKIQELLPDLKKVSLDEFVAEINHVHSSFIRTEADEVTYCLHIILRYEVEQEIFQNHAKVEDLPSVWNQKMQDYLFITPRNDAEGILQDMHWSAGDFGYFPSYLLGNIYDGMFLEAMEAELGPIDPILERGDIAVIRKWLNEKIHRYGSLRLPKEVIEKVTGKPLSAKPLLRYFEKKYLG